MPTLYVDADTFYSVTVSQDGATQELFPSLYADADVFFSATVSIAVSVIKEQDDVVYSIAKIRGRSRAVREEELFLIRRAA